MSSSRLAPHSGSASPPPQGVERVVGFDPGLNVTGYGVLECHGGTVRLIEAGTVKSKGETLEERLLTIHSGIREVIEACKPTAMAIEQVFSNVKFPKTAILLGHARGVICLAGVQAGLAVHHYLPNRVKSTLTGSGHAGKEQAVAGQPLREPAVVIAFAVRGVTDDGMRAVLQMPPQQMPPASQGLKLHQ